MRLNGKCGYIDKTGKMVIEPQYQQAGPFSQGFAAVSLENGTMLYIDPTGKVVWKAPAPTTTSMPTATTTAAVSTTR